MSNLLIVNYICWLIDWLIDWIVFYAISAIFQPYNGCKQSMWILIFYEDLSSRHRHSGNKFLKCGGKNCFRIAVNILISGHDLVTWTFCNGWLFHTQIFFKIIFQFIIHLKFLPLRQINMNYLAYTGYQNFTKTLTNIHCSI